MKNAKPIVKPFPTFTQRNEWRVKRGLLPLRMPVEKYPPAKLREIRARDVNWKGEIQR